MNFFEPLAGALDGISQFANRSDYLALLGIFAVMVTLMRLGVERLQPTFIPLNGILYDIIRWGFGVFTGYVTAGILLTALHTAPLPARVHGLPSRTEHAV